MRYLQIKACKRNTYKRIDLLAVFLGGCVIGFMAGVYIWG